MIAANWKENPRTEAQAQALFRAIAAAQKNRRGAAGAVDVVLCPPFIYLEGISRAFKKMKRAKKGGRSAASGGRGAAARHFALGAQDTFWEERGAFTSEVGPKMLKSLGMEYVIVGHSERRKYMEETDAAINKKIALALADKLKVILCVGESLGVRKRGVTAAKHFVRDQLRKDLAGIRGARIVVAYEPIWAIGTGRYDRPEDAAEMLAFIKDFLKNTCHLKAKVLYGGSVNSKNIGDYVQYKEIDGALVGGASLKAKEFITIIKKSSSI